MTREILSSTVNQFGSVWFEVPLFTLVAHCELVNYRRGTETAASLHSSNVNGLISFLIHSFYCMPSWKSNLPCLSLLCGVRESYTTAWVSCFWVIFFIYVHMSATQGPQQLPSRPLSDGQQRCYVNLFLLRKMRSMRPPPPLPPSIMGRTPHLN